MCVASCSTALCADLQLKSLFFFFSLQTELPKCSIKTRFLKMIYRPKSITLVAPLAAFIPARGWAGWWAG